MAVLLDDGLKRHAIVIAAVAGPKLAVMYCELALAN
jgi:hypothetical protein